MLRALRQEEGDVPLAQEDQPQGGQCVDRDPETCDDLVLERHGRGLGRLLVRGQLLHLELGALAGVDVVDEAVGRGALLYCVRSASVGGRVLRCHVPMAAVCERVRVCV